MESIHEFGYTQQLSRLHRRCFNTKAQKPCALSTIITFDDTGKPVWREDTDAREDFLHRALAPHRECAYIKGFSCFTIQLRRHIYCQPINKTASGCQDKQSRRLQQDHTQSCSGQRLHTLCNVFFGTHHKCWKAKVPEECWTPKQRQASCKER